ncbi:pyruvate kinase [Mesomycoplasma moatsii]|uniref:pyruvate kinase n=1 Tax=Mesomycoplasma moatsii TaxID=171287 RepID=UPI0003B3DF1E
MNFIDKRSKLIGTIGPSSEKYEVLKELVLSGLTCIRANFSHGSYEEQKAKFDNAKRAQQELNVPISLMLDTKGPEIRLGKMKDGAQLIKANTEVIVYTKEEEYQNRIGSEFEWTVSYRMDKDVKKGDKIVFDDGKLVTEVVSVQDGLINIITKNQHLLKTNKRINIPGVEFSLPFLSEKDKKDIIFGIEQNIDYIAASFVNSAKDVNELKSILNANNGSHIKIISKIESQTGINNIDSIIEASDGIMIARGDLGLEIPYYDVPYYEKTIIRKCRKAGKPVIVATQMLDSMERTPQPTRAEVTDVYWATELGADSTMLSGESASGDFPVEAVRVMSTINLRAEKEFYNKLHYPVQLEEVWENSKKELRDEIAYKIAKKAMKGEYRYIVVRSTTGELLKEIAKYRPNAAIIGLVEDEKQIGKFGIVNSVFVSLESPKLFKEVKNDFSKAREALKPYHPKSGDKFLVVDRHDEKEFTF